LISHQQQIFPIDSLWCIQPRMAEMSDANIVPLLAGYCDERGDGPTRNLLEPYRLRMETDPKFDLTRVFGYAPRTVLRRNSGTGGDAALGNMTALSMMIRRRVEAEFAVTNTLGIRDNLYPGLVNLETIYNVFPFENTITVMYLSGREVQELFDFITERSGGRGCQSQAQIAGASFTMDCGQAIRNAAHVRCSSVSDCCASRPDIRPCDPNAEGSAVWECNEGSCYAHPAEDILMNGQPLNPNGSYKLATNDYIAKGGSGFKVLKRNTTKVFTGIALRDALVEYLTRLPTCSELFAADPNSVDSFSLSYCLWAKDHADNILLKGSCLCSDARQGNTQKCGAITPPMLQFCDHPMDFPIIVGWEDGRIRRKIK
jgi:5'-nucleotidase / UDP-sugar diphosphatase